MRWIRPFQVSLESWFKIWTLKAPEIRIGPVVSQRPYSRLLFCSNISISFGSFFISGSSFFGVRILTLESLLGVKKQRLNFLFEQPARIRWSGKRYLAARRVQKKQLTNEC